jgi:hypothetical protein
MQYQDASAGLVAVWAVALLISGTGIGMAWPHLSAWAMSRVDDPGEGPAAAAAVNPMQLICGAFGTGLASVVVNQRGPPRHAGSSPSWPSSPSSARWGLREVHVAELGVSQRPYSDLRMSPARSPMAMQGAIVLPVVMRGMMDPSAIRSRSTP